MPYRKKNRAKNPRRKHRKYQKRKAKYQKAITTHMRGAGFADSVSVRLNYVDNLIVSPGAVYSSYVFRGNSCFDPDYTGTGHQPMYFDQYSEIYNKYRVLGCAIRVDLNNASTASALYFICFPSTDIATLTSVSQALEQGRAKSPKIVPLGQTMSSARIKEYCSTRKALGQTKVQVMDEDNAANIGATPNQVWYWNLFWESTDQNANVISHAIIKLTYYVQFFDKKVGTQS